MVDFLKMTISQVADPKNWSEQWRWIVGGLCAIALTIFGGGQMVGTITSKIETLGVTMTEVKTKVDTAVANQATQRDLTTSIQSNIKILNDSVTDIRTEQKDVKDALGKDHDRTSEAIELVKKQGDAAASARLVYPPRIDALEKEQAALTTGLAVIGAKLDGIDARTTRIENITTSHDADIKATRNAVAPKDFRPH
jgi:chromosome segregation ATPase